MNMSYCRFHNTLSDLQDCYIALLDGALLEGELSPEETKDRDRLIELCETIARFAEEEREG